MHLHKKDKEVINRLSKIEGHVHSIKTMVEEGRECSDILIQIAAVRAALDQAGKVILEDHIESCIAKAINEGEGEEAISKLKDALSKFIR